MFHVQQPVNDWLRAVARLPAGALAKAVAVQWLAEAKAANPNVATLLRYVNDGMQHVSPGDTDAIREQRARAWFNAFIDGTFLDGSTAGVAHWQATNAVSWWNEYYAQSQSAAEKELWWRQERVAARIWRDEYRRGAHAAKLGHIRLAVCAAPVGNDIPWQSAETATTYDCILDYHGYNKYLGRGQRDPLSWQYHSGRWATMDADFRSRGFTCDWLLGEAGPYAGVLEGWRHDLVLGGDTAAYIEDVRWFVRQIKTTHAYQTGRMKGFALFTTGGGDTWRYYETRQPELDALADMIRAEWTHVALLPSIPPAPEPDPPAPLFVVDYIAALPTVDPAQYPFTVRRLAEIESIIIHHSVGLPTNPPESIHQGHVNRGWPRIGYHFYITGDGTVYKTNLLTTRSFHAGAGGNDGLGVCLAGDFTAVHPSREQLDATARLLGWLHDVLGEKNVLKHRDVAATQCPGNTWAEWWAELMAEPQPEPEPGVPYVVTVNLLPQTATLAQLQHVAEQVYPQRQTVLFSADDAARLVAPGQPGSKVRVWGDWPGIAAWLAARGVRIVEQWDFPGDGGWDFPIGTAAERAAAANDWPGDWIDANGYGNLYELGGGTAYHTGADLNLNAPRWDADKDAPVYAAAAGVVTYAARVPAPSTWGRLVVIRHDGGVYSRYAHLGSMLVTAGQTVAKGQQIGTIGGAEFGLANHLHFDVSPTERLATAPLDWPGMTWSRIERDYVNPLIFVLGRKA